MRLILGLFVLTLPALYSAPAAASCGLDQCPSDWSAAPEEVWTLTSMTRATSVADAFYIEEFVGLRRVLPWNLRAGFALPVVHVEQSGQTHTGLGNMVAVLDYISLGQSAKGYGIGLQAELPTASETELGDGHVVVLPYVRGWFAQSRFDVRMQLGWGYTLEGGGHHHHHEHGDSGEGIGGVSRVNPHSNSELLARGSVGVAARPDTTLRAGFDAVFELESGEQVLQAIIGVEHQHDRVTIGLFGEIPVTTLQRFDRRARLTVGWRL